MTAFQPRHLVHRGTVLVHGFLFDPSLLGESETKRRVLAAWAPGAQAERRGYLWLLRLAKPRWMAVGACPSTPLVEQGPLLTSAPLEPREREQLAASPGAIVHVVEGRAGCLPAVGERLDLAGWIDLELYLIERAAGLGAPPAPIPVSSAVTVERSSFAVPPPAPELAAVMAALQRQPPPLSGTIAGTRPTSAPSGSSWWSRLLGILGLGATRPALPAAPRTEKVALAVLTPTERLPWLDRVRRAFTGWVATSRLASVLGQRQADYLVRMMEMFQDGDFDAALRHAVPLYGSVDGSSALPALGVPAPRSSLTIGIGSTIPVTTAMGLGPTLFGELQQMYRRAVAQLERAGRIEEAAFILAELLKASAEAVAFLERHGRLRLAAELAEGRGLPPELVVRQWFRAKEIERAVEVARRTGCFAAAVVQLEAKEPERGRALRVLWAEALAEAGDYPAAVLAVWPVVEARRLAKHWIDRALALGGSVEGAMLVRKVVLVPEAFESVRERVEALCDEGSLEGAPARRALTEALSANDPLPETAVLARAALRSHLRDRAAGHTAADPRLLTRLDSLVADPVLHADLPPLAALVRGRTSTEARTLTVAASDVGTLPLRDLALLPGGRLLVALGEAGVRLLTPDGRLIAHFDFPAERLVISDSGARAIGLAARGDGWRLSRFDLIARTGAEWGETPLEAFAADYDGSLWFVAGDGAVQALDATASRLKALWRVGDVGQVSVLRRSPRQVAFLTSGSLPGLWQYDLPGLTLRGRELPAVVAQAGDSAQFAPWLGKGLVALSKVEGVGPLQALRLDAPGAAWSGSPVLFTASEVAPHALLCGGVWVVAAVREREQIRVDVRGADRQSVAVFELQGSTRLMLRLGPEETLALADDRGRVLVYRLDHGTLLRDLRL